MTLKQVLMIVYFFPSLGGSGALRPLKLARYLPDNGWQPVVLTVKNPDWYYAKDPELMKELPAGTVVHRARMVRSAWIYRGLNPFRSKSLDQWLRQTLIHPDSQVGWIPAAHKAGLGLVRRHDIQAIYSTSAPLSCHLIAYLIKKKTGLPWIADFRDEWVENPDISFPTRWHRQAHFALEKRIVDDADHVIAAAPGFCDLLKKHQPASEKLSTLTMGFDPADFQPGQNNGILPRVRDRFTIVFSGLFYGSFRPTCFLNAVSELIDENKIDPDAIRINFVGANSADETGFKDVYRICNFIGFVSHARSVELIKDSDALLLLLSRERGGIVIPSKTFEYIASGVPILALVPPDGTAASIIRKTRTGVVVDFEDTEGIKTALMQLYQGWLYRNTLFLPDYYQIEKFNQKRLTSRFASLLNRLVA